MTTKKSSSTGTTPTKQQQQHNNSCLHKALTTILVLSVLLTSFLIYYAFYALYYVNGKGDECELKAHGNTLTHFKTNVNCSDWLNPPNLSDYFLSSEKNSGVHRLETDIQFLANDGFGPISAWFLPAQASQASESESLENVDVSSIPTVIVVHGFRVCKNHFTTLTPTVMLHRGGYNVLLIDLRNHGKSAKQMPTPFCTFGSKEHHDIMGAVTYLKQRFGENHKIGLYGVSMGGATSLIAGARDERISAIYLDSPVCQVYETLQGNVRNMLQGLPVIQQIVPTSVLNQFSILLMKGTCMFGRYVLRVSEQGGYGCHPFVYEPSRELTRIKNGKNKAFHFDHAEKDILVPVSNTHVCSQIIKSGEHKHVSVFIQDKVGEAPIQWHGMCRDHTVMAIHEISQRKYEKRLIGFFNTHLPLHE